MGRQIDMKLSIVFVATALFIFSFANGGFYAYQHVSADENVLEEGIKIGPVDVGGLTKEEASAKLETAIANWHDHRTINVQGGKDQRKQSLPSQIYVFDISSSISQAAESGNDSAIVVELKKDLVKDELKQLLNADVWKALDMSKVERDLLLPAQHLEQGEFTYFMLDYADISSEGEQVVAYSTLSSSDTPKLAPYFDSQKSFVLAPHNTFSILDAFHGNNASNQKAEELSMIASVLYEAVLKTNFVIVERFTGRELPSYVDPGFESKIEPGKLDLKFYNPNANPYTIAFDIDGDNLSVDITGSPFIFTYEVKVRDKTTFDPKTIVHYSPSLSYGEKRVKEKGKSGLLVRVYRHERDSAGDTINQALISEDFYPPVHQIEEWSHLQPSGDEGVTPAPVEESDDSGSGDAGSGSFDEGDGNQDTGQEESIWDVPGEIQKGF